MLNRVVEQASDQEIPSRKETPTEERIQAAVLYHAGLSYRDFEAVISVAHETVRQWFLWVARLFDQAPDHRSMVAVDETKVSVEDTGAFVWTAVDAETFEVVHVEVSPGRSNLNALLLLKQALKRCRGQPIVVVDRGPQSKTATGQPRTMRVPP